MLANQTREPRASFPASVSFDTFKFLKRVFKIVQAVEAPKSIIYPKVESHFFFCFGGYKMISNKGFKLKYIFQSYDSLTLLLTQLFGGRTSCHTIHPT